MSRRQNVRSPISMQDVANRVSLDSHKPTARDGARQYEIGRSVRRNRCLMNGKGCDGGG